MSKGFRDPEVMVTRTTKEPMDSPGGWWGVKLLGRKEVDKKLGGQPSGQGTGGEKGEQGGQPGGKRG